MGEHFPTIIRQWLDDQRNANNESIDTATKEAANIAGASQATSAAAKGTEPVNRKERTSYNAPRSQVEPYLNKHGFEKRTMTITIPHLE